MPTVYNSFAFSLSSSWSWSWSWSSLLLSCELSSYWEYFYIAKMCSMSALKCPLCAQTNFPSIDALRVSLIKVANGPLVCPICHELFLGLDKLTIHLFSHTSTMTVATVTTATATTPTTNTTTALAIPKTSKASVTIETADTSTTSLPTLTPTSTSTSTPKRASREKKPKKTRQQSDAPKSAAELKLKDTVVTFMSTPQSNAIDDTVGALESNNIAFSTNKGIASSTNNTLSTCDICELTFRDADLRDMHFQLVHRNLAATTTQQATSSTSSSATSPPANEPEFKCHLCTKSFKMKGSLRVHLKVVHLPQAGNMPKLSICDRIRHKEINKKSTANINVAATLPPPTKMDHTPQSSNEMPSNAITNAISSLQQASPLPQTQQSLAQSTCNIAIANTNGAAQLAQLPNGFTFGTLTLLPTTASVASNLLSVGASGGVAAADGAMVQAAVDNAALNSNVLLLFNANAPPTVASTAATAPVNGFKTEDQTPELDMDVQNKCGTTGNPKAWECDVCAKAFTTKYFLKKHKRLHTGEMPYTCEICARTFTFQQSYHKHLLYHSNEKPHVCSTCGRAFKELSTLHNHERIHSGEKPFKCEVCGKCFRQRVSFLVHTRIHTGVRPYKCEVCEKSFRYKVSQRTHKCQPLSNETSEATSDAVNDNQSEPQSQLPTQVNLSKLVDPKTAAADDISECFIKEFLENTKAHIRDSQCSPASAEIASITDGDCHENRHETEALLTKAIDDIVVESCNKMGIGGHVAPTNCLTQNIDDGCNSPTQRLQNMRLYSPQLVVPEMIDGGGGDGVDIFPRFLLDDVESNML